jgi:hypothetical protein
MVDRFAAASRNCCSVFGMAIRPGITSAPLPRFPSHHSVDHRSLFCDLPDPRLSGPRGQDRSGRREEAFGARRFDVPRSTFNVRRSPFSVCRSPFGRKRRVLLGDKKVKRDALLTHALTPTSRHDSPRTTRRRAEARHDRFRIWRDPGRDLRSAATNLKAVAQHSD